MSRAAAGLCGSASAGRNMFTIVFLTLLWFLPPVNTAAQDAASPADNAGPENSAILAAPPSEQDANVRARLRKIYSEIGELERVTVEVSEGVVKLGGTVANEPQAREAVRLANRMEAVVTVDDSIERSLSVRENLTPLFADARKTISQWLRAAPLALVALLLFCIVAYAGHLLSKWSGLWRKLAPNVFLADLAAQAVRLLALFLGLLLGLSVLGANTVTSAVLGGLGVLGLAVGLAVRETIENYVASILLSLRQPFRREDHVIIDDHEGLVVRLTTRATHLITLDGNHLRIPNSAVFKATILNYSTNPERRFGFVLGVDADDDPAAAMDAGLEALQTLEWVMIEPAPLAVIDTVGDSSILINYMGWIDQRDTNFGKARSLAIRAVKNALEQEGFTLPEPIYRLRFDSRSATTSGITIQELGGDQQGKDAVVDRDQPSDSKSGRSPAPGRIENTGTGAAKDVSPEESLRAMATQARAMEADRDLLDEQSPTE